MGHFLPFLATLVSRLLTDFARGCFGHIRKPAWLAKKRDPLWETAYRLLMVENYGRHETIAQLQMATPERAGWMIDRGYREDHPEPMPGETAGGGTSNLDAG
ncbi:MAG: hypothetical protein ACREBC_08935 [Pyrinomonadaceae bacterium]